MRWSARSISARPASATSAFNITRAMNRPPSGVEMLSKPVDRCTTCNVEPRQIRVEVSAWDEDKLLGFERSLISCEGEVRERDRIVRSNDHEQRRRRDPGYPSTGLIHARQPGGACCNSIFPFYAFAERLQIKINRFSGSVGGRNSTIRINDRLTARQFAPQLRSFVVIQSRLKCSDPLRRNTA